MEEKAKVITPEQFADMMRKLVTRWDDDEEVFRIAADNLITIVLEQLGYGEGVKILLEHPKWYS